MTTILSPDDGAVVDSLHGWQKDFIREFSAERYGDDRVREWEMPEGLDEISATLPARIELRWKGGSPDSLRISEDPSLSNPAAVTVLDSRENSARVTNLTPGRTYYWTVGDAAPRSFSAADSPVRHIYADRLKNVRDIGGKRTRGGKKVKHGLVFRGVRLEHNGDEPFEITDGGRKTLTCDLGIKGEIDLRDDTDLEASLISDGVKYVRIPFWDHASILKDEGIVALRAFFLTLTDPSMLPVYIHCAAGADRTGAGIAYLLALLGVPAEDIYLDFIETVPSLYPDERRNWKGPGQAEYHAGLIRERAGEPDGDLSALMRDVVYSLGIPKDDLDRLRDMLVE